MILANLKKERLIALRYEVVLAKFKTNNHIKHITWILYRVFRNKRQQP